MTKIEIDLDWEDEDEYNEYIDQLAEDYAIAMGFDDADSYKHWLMTEYEDGDYYV